MRNKAIAVFGAVLVCFNAPTVNAETREIWHGWMNLTPCSTLVTDNGFPYLKTGPQELHGRLYTDVPNEQWVVDHVKNCANRGVAVATIAGVLTSWGSVYPAFTAEFTNCLANFDRAMVDRFVNSINLRTESICT